MAYKYLGASMVVEADHPAVPGGLPEGPPSGKLSYAGAASGGYDGLDRLRDFRRGQLTASGQVLDTVATVSRAQQWSLDAVGNWVAFKQDAGDGGTWDHEQTRDHNKANEIEDDSDTGTDAIEQVTGAKWLDPAYDLAGNMAMGPRPGAESDGTKRQFYTYDAWNRLARVVQDNDDDGSDGIESEDPESTDTILATFQYDGLNRRIVKEDVPAEKRYHYYYNESWQVLEVREDNRENPTYEQYVWGIQYVDAPVVRFRDTADDGTLDETLYYTYDGNFNVTGLIGTDGTVAERYVYDPYGKVSFLDGSWGALSASAYDNQILYCGYRYDPESGLYQVRYRYLHSALGRWVTRDRILYPDGMNLYEYVRSIPTGLRDPSGLTTKSDIPTVLEYTCKCGWIDWNHAGPSVTDGVIDKVKNTKDNQEFSIGMGQGALHGAVTSEVGATYRMYLPKERITPGMDIWLAMELFMDLAERFEAHQGDVFGFAQMTKNMGLRSSVDSSFSEEDLVSDIIGFNRAALIPAPQQEDVRRVCGGFADLNLRTVVSLNVWNHMPGGALQTGYRKWTPKYHTKDTCGYCSTSDEKWPMDELPWHPDNPLRPSPLDFYRSPAPLAGLVRMWENFNATVYGITRDWTRETGWTQRDTSPETLERWPSGPYHGLGGRNL